MDVDEAVARRSVVLEALCAGGERKARGGRRGSGEHLGRFDFFSFLSALHADKTWDMAPPPAQPPPETTLLAGFENRPHWVGAPVFCSSRAAIVSLTEVGGKNIRWISVPACDGLTAVLLFYGHLPLFFKVVSSPPGSGPVVIRG